MKTITLTQPWATLVVIRAKMIETRSWGTSYRGPLGIHAGKGLGDMDEQDLRDLCAEEPFRSVLHAAGITSTGQLPRGAMLGQCALEGCFTFTPASIADLSAQELAFGNYDLGRKGFVLSGAEAFAEPIPMRGALSLWEWPGL